MALAIARARSPVLKPVRLNCQLAVVPARCLAPPTAAVGDLEAMAALAHLFSKQVPKKFKSCIHNRLTRCGSATVVVIVALSNRPL